MVRRGYREEYTVKTKLQKMFGKFNVIKVAIGQNGPDFIVINSAKNAPWKVTGFEVKSTKKKTYYPSKHDREQWEFLCDWIEQTRTQVDYWIITREGRKLQHETLTHHSFGNKYLKRNSNVRENKNL